MEGDISLFLYGTVPYQKRVVCNSNHLASCGMLVCHKGVQDGQFTSRDSNDTCFGYFHLDTNGILTASFSFSHQNEDILVCSLFISHIGSQLVFAAVSSIYSGLC